MPLNQLSPKRYVPRDLGGLRLTGDDLSPLLQVCYDFAIEAHVDQGGKPRLRQKADGVTLEYHYHPLLASKFLSLAGINDPIRQAALLCHDIREETPRTRSYHVDHEGSGGAFESALIERLQAHGDSLEFPGLEPASTAEGKRHAAAVFGRSVAAQVDQLSFKHASSAAHKEAALRQRLAALPDCSIGKAADALASLFEDVHLKTSKEYPNRRKIIERSEAIAAAVEPLQPMLARLIHVLCGANRELMATDASQQREIKDIRQRYRWENLLGLAAALPDRPRPDDIPRLPDGHWPEPGPEPGPSSAGVTVQEFSQGPAPNVRDARGL